jgi:branched-chain amino acid transport system substrate-binding protein
VAVGQRRGAEVGFGRQQPVVRQAVEEFTAQNPSIRVEIIAADHQNKPDVGVNTVRQWLDQRGVDVVTDVGNSAIALGINPVCVERDRIHLNASAGTSELTGRACTPNTIHWSYDTWCLSNTSGTALTRAGGDSWYFITADYAFGHAIERDTTRFVEAAGGKLLGASRYPFPQTTDFSAFLLQAQASKAKVLGLAMAGDDLVNCVKQAQEFGLGRSGITAARALKAGGALPILWDDGVSGRMQAEAEGFTVEDRAIIHFW